MLTRLFLLAYLVASLSATDATPGQTLRVYAGCDIGRISIDAPRGLQASATHGTGLAQWADVRVLPDALPGLRWVGVECGGARTELALTVREAGSVVFVPWATASPGG